jgi:hypothetical protein
MVCNVHSTLHAMITRHKPHRTVTTRRSRPESAPKPPPYRIKSQHCGRHTYNHLRHTDGQVRWVQPQPPVLMRVLSLLRQFSVHADEDSTRSMIYRVKAHPETESYKIQRKAYRPGRFRHRSPRHSGLDASAGGFQRGWRASLAFRRQVPRSAGFSLSVIP